MKIVKDLSQITSDLENIDYTNPVFCNIDKIVEFNEENQFYTVILADNYGNRSIGFIYGFFAKLFKKAIGEGNLTIPCDISIIKGKIKSLSQNKMIIEMYHVIFQNTFFINSSLLGGHEFCPMQTYMNAYINTDSQSNEHQLWGNLIHDYLSYLYSRRYLYQTDLWKNQTKLKEFILDDFKKACYDNHAYFLILEENMDEVIETFKDNFLDSELEFYKSEIRKYGKEFGDFSFICEKMIYSKLLGLQGRIDRLVQNNKSGEYYLYETKTGMSSAEAQTKAFYQTMAYATVLREYYNTKINTLYLEFPRKELDERIVEKQYDPEGLKRIIKNRNEIWNIMKGHQPDFGPYLLCSRCYSKDACEFYCYRKNQKNQCKKHEEKCHFYNYFEQSKKRKLLFERINAYFSWFFHLLDLELQKNIELMNEAFLPSNERERKGNCIGNLQIRISNKANNNKKNRNKNDNAGLEGAPKGKDMMKDVKSENKGENQITSEKTNVHEVKLFKQGTQKIKNTRMRTGDYVLITPESYSPLSSESQRGIITKVGENFVNITLSKELKIDKKKQKDMNFRVDLTTSNYMIKLEKRSIDKLIRQSTYTQQLSQQKLRDLLLFRKKPQQYKKIPNLLKSSKIKLDPSQRKALRSSLRAKDIFLIQGPPGTGKTTLIAELIENFLSKIKPKKNKQGRTLLQYLNTNDQKPTRKIPIMISAFTNKGLDNLIIKIMDNNPSTKITRLGKLSSMDERVEKLSLIKKGQKRVKYTNGEQELVLPPKRISKVLDQTDILASTTTMAGNLIIKNTEFDTIILDEAGQISEPTALNSLLKGKKYILVGDHMQLPPISNIELDNVPEESQKYFDLLHFSKEKHLSQSIFERLVHHYREKDHCFSLLSYQYRMNKTISKFISEHFYEGKLRSGEIKGKSIGEQKFSQFLATLNLKISIFQQNEGEKHEKKGKFGQLVFGSDLPMIFLDTMEIQMFDSTIDEESKDLESKFNRGEGKIIAHLMLWFVSKILKNTRYIEIEEWENIFSNIGIISPYRAQNQKIREMIKQGINNKLAYVKKEKDTIINKEDIIESIMNNLTVDTVDRFQGGEKEIIIYSFVDSNRDRTLSSLHLEIRRLNVSISRAKKKIIFVGNSQTLCTNKNEKNEEISEKKGDNGSKLERHSRPHRKIKVKNLYRDLKNYIEQNEGYQKLAQDTLDGENKNERTHHIGKK